MSVLNAAADQGRGGQRNSHWTWQDGAEWLQGRGEEGMEANWMRPRWEAEMKQRPQRGCGAWGATKMGAIPALQAARRKSPAFTGPGVVGVFWKHREMGKEM